MINYFALTVNEMGIG